MKRLIPIVFIFHTPIVWAGIVFNMDAAQTVDLPEFRYTNEALAYGKAHKDDNAALYALTKKRDELMGEYKEARRISDVNPTNENINRAIVIATKKQLIREALEASGHPGSSFYAGSYVISH